MVLEEESSRFNRVECLEVGMGLKVGCEVCNRICSLGIFGVCSVHGLTRLSLSRSCPCTRHQSRSLVDRRRRRRRQTTRRWWRLHKLLATSQEEGEEEEGDKPSLL